MTWFPVSTCSRPNVVRHVVSGQEVRMVIVPTRSAELPEAGGDRAPAAIRKYNVKIWHIQHHETPTVEE